MLVWCYAALIAVSLLAGALLGVRPAARSASERLVRAVLPAALVLAAAGVLARILDAPFFAYNDGRLSAAFAVRYGYSLYAVAEGPLLFFIYGPIGPLFYLPATLFATPTPALVCGALIAAGCVHLPVLWLLLRGGNRRAEALLLFCLFAVFAIATPALLYSSFSIHVDAPALALGALACAVAAFRVPSSTLPRSLLCALLASLSVWSKQNMAPLMVALAAFVFCSEPRREFVRFVACLAIVGALVSGVLVLTFGPLANMYYFVLQVPASVPMEGSSIASLGVILLELAATVLGPLAICLAGFILELRAARRDRQPGSAFLRAQPWLLFFLAGVLILPLAVVARMKQGGDVNGLSFVSYFLALGALLFLKQLFAGDDCSLLRRARVATVALVMAMSFGVVARTLDGFESAECLEANPSQSAYQWCRQHPGEVYFPWNPTAVLLAEKRLYHFAWGLYTPLSKERLEPDLPPRFTAIAFPSGGQRDCLRAFPEYSRSRFSLKFPGWEFFVRPDAK